MTEEERTLTISSIGDLQLALIEEDNGAIKNYIERLDRETANEAMSQVGEFFGFPTVKVGGVVLTSGEYLASKFGYKNARGLQKLLERREIYGVKVGGFVHDVRSNINDTLGLKPGDYSSILYDWPAFLIGGMNSTNKEAQAVQAYLLKMERVARVGVVAVKQKHSIANFPDSAQGLVLTKLADRAWRGNPIAAYVLENYYDVPVNRLMEKVTPDMSDLAGTIVQYLHALMDSDPSKWGIEKGVTQEGAKYLQGETTNFFNAFVCLARQERLPRFFRSVTSLGAVLSREAEALEYLGWRRSMGKMARGRRYHRYEYLNATQTLQ